MADPELKRTPLYDLHRELGARMVPFAGYEMPVQYPAGILKEHLHTRAQAALFDVSHMGQVRLRGTNPAAALETLVTGDIQGLAPSCIRYTLFTNDDGGIIDDLLVTNAGDHLALVVNAACKDGDLAHLRARLGDRASVEYVEDRGLLALQGPAAAAVLARQVPAVATMPFMSYLTADLVDGPAIITRSGYTGEDGFEISIPSGITDAVARRLLAEPEVAPVGLGARDSLRLECGLCLYGHDIDATTTPVEAALSWAIGKRRRDEGGFPGAAVILDQLRTGTTRRRVGLQPEGRQPAREHTEITDLEGKAIGSVTSGGFGPTVNGPVAMGYVTTAHAATGSRVLLSVRGKALPAAVVPLPFVKQNYYRG